MKPFSQGMRQFWNVETLEAAQNERVTIPANPAIWNDEYQARQLAAFLDRPLAADMVVLDYGCGVGRASRALALQGIKVIAVDVAPKMLEHLKQYCGDLDVRCELSDGYGCPTVASASLDAAISQYCFQHMPSREIVCSVLADIHRMLKPSAWFRLQSIDHGQEVQVDRAEFLGVRQRLSEMLSAAESTGFKVASVICETLPDGVSSYVMTLEKIKHDHSHPKGDNHV
ncbi:MAG: class I SAM-dependent methyltransferase [Pirellulaceae bacterium]